MKILYKINFIFYLLALVSWCLYVAGEFSFGGCLECSKNPSPVMNTVRALLGWGGLVWLTIGVTTSIMKRRHLQE